MTSKLSDFFEVISVPDSQATTVRAHDDQKSVG
jgi:hypothetical protein